MQVLLSMMTMSLKKENVPINGGTVSSTYKWGWDGIDPWRQSSGTRSNPKMIGMSRLTLSTLNLPVLFLHLFLSDFIEGTLLPTTNASLPVTSKTITKGEFLHWLGLWFLMATLKGCKRPSFWSSSKIEAFWVHLIVSLIGCLVVILNKFTLLYCIQELLLQLTKMHSMKSVTC